MTEKTGPAARSAWAALALLAFAGHASAGMPFQTARSLVDLSLEQLSNIVVTSVSRRDEPLSGAAASIYVITAEDIRRSGAASLPEALRLAPNLQVARADASQYAISARGFNSTIANKLLVLIDGRTVYTPLFSGTFWEVQDVMLEDLDRIEVISGPGATLWGANAVNGVINVITRSAAETQGVLASARAGTTGRDAAVRHGGELGGGHYRVYAKALRREATALPSGVSNDDQADQVRLGFRADWGRPDDGVTLQGDAYSGEIDQVATAAREMNGLNLLGRLTRDLGLGASLRAQAYYERTFRHHPGAFREHLDTLDFELQHGLSPAGRHRLLWGLGWRHHRDDVENSAAVAFIPGERTLDQSHFFAQDEITLRPGLELTLGAKLETNSYTGTEFLPSARLGWRLAPGHFVWTALSRAVRAPSRIDRELFSPGTPPFAVAGGPDFRSEISRVFELGYRAQPVRAVSLSVTGFYHDHEHLRTLSPAPGGAVIANDLEGRTSGFEGWASWRPAAWWRLSGGLVRLYQSLSLRPGAVDLQSPASIGSDPDSWWKLRAQFDLGPAHGLDVLVRHYEGLANRNVPAYTALDLRLGWTPRPDLEVSLGLENLLDPGHVEWGPGAEFERAAFLRARLSF